MARGAPTEQRVFRLLTNDAIHNPSEPRHFMDVTPVSRCVRISLGARQLAQSKMARRIIEVGKTFYRPMIYVPTDDVAAELRVSERTTSCPLKGQTTYFDLYADGITVPLYSMH